MTKAVRVSLAYRAPFDWGALIGFLAARATPGVEVVEADGYRRTIAIDGRVGTLAVGLSSAAPAIDLAIRFPDARAHALIVARVRRMFDLDGDPAVVAEHLGGDPWLGPVLTRHPGLRTPGAWDGFEVSVRAILGQQVSVAAATTVAGRLARRFGGVVEGADGLNRLFPVPEQLAEAPIEEVGVISARAGSIRALACAVLAGDVRFSNTPASEVTRSLEALRGIGPWTAQYIAMRALGDPDAFLAGDLILRQRAGGCSARELERHAERWRPWRASAVMLMWQAATDAQKDMDEVGRLRPISLDARGDRRRARGGQKHPRKAAGRPVPQRGVRRR
ncbi:MAG: DNA-3-methyladenine glycosylase [Acidobacteriota bacterium]|nr:DNA-3-methyladenine glycosylase [Acidobacteriota bacterium]